VTISGHDAKWWHQFTVAPPLLQKAMHSTLKAREILELRVRLGIDDDAGLAAYEQRLRDCEETEQQIREALNLVRPDPPNSGTAPVLTPSRGPAAERADLAAAAAIDRIW